MAGGPPSSPVGGSLQIGAVPTRGLLPQLVRMPPLCRIQEQCEGASRTSRLVVAGAGLAAIIARMQFAVYVQLTHSVQHVLRLPKIFEDVSMINAVFVQPSMPSADQARKVLSILICNQTLSVRPKSHSVCTHSINMYISSAYQISVYILRKILLPRFAATTYPPGTRVSQRPAPIRVALSSTALSCLYSSRCPIYSS